MKKKKSEDVGLIVGRFQTYRLHKAHTELIELVLKNHHKVIIMLGVAELGFVYQDPLNFESRKQMILEKFPDGNIEILPIYDCKDDYVWSNNLDSEIKRLCRNATVILYGGSDSCIKRYHGNLPTKTFTTRNFERATNIREAINSNYTINEEFRKAIIFTVQNQYPRVDPCVDVLIINSDTKEVLLGKKKIDNGLYRFIGGYFDGTKDKCLKDTVKREVQEEAGNIEISNIESIDDSIIDDWRYAGRKEKLLSSFFIAYYNYGQPQPGDDLDGLIWISIDDFITNENNLIPEHRIFLTNHLKTKLKN